jgi:hypothetical protein
MRLDKKSKKERQMKAPEIHARYVYKNWTREAAKQSGETEI